MRVLIVGGGGGGGSGAAGGGAAGFVRSEVFELKPNVVVKITVGKGGKGSTLKDNCSQDSQPGGRSFSVDTFTRMAEKTTRVPVIYNWQGASGGSGGGEGCNYTSGYCGSGSGGSGGSNGNYASHGETFGFGRGQGNYTKILKQFNQSSISAGAGGKGRLYAAAGGGGAGGILIDGLGPSGGDGAQPAGSQGGKGYGAGGGSGFIDLNKKYYFNTFLNGGDGADGVVYIEWFTSKERTAYTVYCICILL